MEVIPNKTLLKYNSNMVENVRKEYNLDKPGAMERAIDILQDWIAKQEHFVKKDFPRDYLERFIIASKGSVEKAKTRIGRLCTLRTVAPNLFDKCHAKKDFTHLREFALNILMPYPTEDDCRIHIGKLLSSRFISPASLLELYQHQLIRCEYGKLYDYVKGYYTVIDIGDLDIVHAMTKVDLTDLRNCITMITEAHGVRIMSIYLITTSTMINAIMRFAKQFLSPKVCDKIHILRKAEELHEFLPRKLLPKDFGGDQKSMLEIYDEMNEELSSEKHVSFMEEMRQASTDEKLRSPESFNQEYLGMPGSFKTLSVD